jgi:hypothetical protein
MADELRFIETEAWRGMTVQDAVNDDSAGLRHIYAAMTDEKDDFRGMELGGSSDPLVYLYAFVLHPDFAECKLPVLDGFSCLMSPGALILTGSHDWIGFTELAALGFEPWIPKKSWSPTRPPGYFDSGGDLSSLFIRVNSKGADFQIADHRSRCPRATMEHAKWVDERAPAV